MDDGQIDLIDHNTVHQHRVFQLASNLAVNLTC
jgi:hypothetical protein